MAKSPKENDRQAAFRLVAELGSERYVVERIRVEMDKRGWSQAELSRRMEESAREGNGGVLHQGVLSKLLRGDRGRHVSIDQLITLSKVFAIPLNELLVPDAVLSNVRGWRYLMEAADVQNEIRELEYKYADHLLLLRPMLAQSPELVARIREYREELRAKLTLAVLGYWRGDHGRAPTEAEIEEELSAMGVPALVAVEHALSRYESDEAKQPTKRGTKR